MNSMEYLSTEVKLIIAGSVNETDEFSRGMIHTAFLVGAIDSEQYLEALAVIKNRTFAQRRLVIDMLEAERQELKAGNKSSTGYLSGMVAMAGFLGAITPQLHEDYDRFVDDIWDRKLRNMEKTT